MGDPMTAEPVDEPIDIVMAATVDLPSFEAESGSARDKAARRLAEAEALVRLAAEILDDWGGSASREDQAAAAELDSVADGIARCRLGLSKGSGRG